MTARSLCALLFSLSMLCGRDAGAQNRPIGRWRAHLPYNQAVGVATDGMTLYTITQKGFFTYNAATGDIETFSKVEGLHETGTAAIAYDVVTGTCIIAYENSNIDLFRHHNFKVLPDLKNKSYSGDKTVNHIYAANGLAYLSTSLGIVVLDLNRQQVKETYVFSRGGQTIGINAFTADSAGFYAATPLGLYRTPRSNPTPQVFSSWQPVDTLRGYKQLTTLGSNTVYATSSSDTVFRLTPSGMRRVIAGDSITSITRIDGGKSTLYVGRRNIRTGAARIYALSQADSVVDSVYVGFPKGTVELADGQVWLADLYQGLGKHGQGLIPSFVVPAGPDGPENADLYAHNGELWIAQGGINSSYNPRGMRASLSRFRDEKWQIYQPYTYTLFSDSVYDFLSVIKDRRDGTLYAGTYKSGLFELKPDGNGRIIKQGALFPSTYNPADYSATSMALDAQGNLWVTQIFTPYELAMRAPDGTWSHFAIPDFGRGTFRLAFGLMIDDYDQKWFYSGLGGGVIVYNEGNTVQLTTGKGQGNLPNNLIRCIVKDRDGAVWIGTDNGIGIVNCPGSVMDRSCEAEQRVVQYDQFAGHLFDGESVRAIAVDGANRKWIGTTNGVWLLTPDAGKILNRFTVDNSPLPSNTIQKIAIDEVTGDVYIGTDQGLISYRGTATEGGSENAQVQVFPSPVPSGYSGPIAIRGVVTDADVRITDISGQLIYRARATGGQLVWNGLDYTGTRPQSGVYLIFITNKDGSQTTVGKMMFLH